MEQLDSKNLHSCPERKCVHHHIYMDGTSGTGGDDEQLYSKAELQFDCPSSDRTSLRLARCTGGNKVVFSKARL